MAAEIKAVDVLLKIGSQVIGGQKSASLEMNNSPIEVTTKSSNGWTDKIPGKKAWSTTCDALFWVSDEGQTAAYTAFENNTVIDVELSNSTGYYRKGRAVITSISEEAGEDDVVSFSVSLEGTGPLILTKG